MSFIDVENQMRRVIELAPAASSAVRSVSDEVIKAGDESLKQANQFTQILQSVPTQPIRSGRGGGGGGLVGPAGAAARTISSGAGGGGGGLVNLASSADQRLVQRTLQAGFDRLATIMSSNGDGGALFRARGML